MSEPFAPVETPHPGLAGLSRLRSLIGRSSCPPRPADGLLSRWHRASGTSLSFDEWCDPSARSLATALRVPYGPREIDTAVVEFAQARSGADHTAEAVAADLVALVHVLQVEGSPAYSDRPGLEPRPPRPKARHDAVGLVARALTAWAKEQVEVVSAGACTDPVTGLVTGGFLRARLRELHAQCDALAIAPPVTFGSLVVRLDFEDRPAPERLGARVTVGRVLVNVFKAGETVAALGVSRFVAVMPAYALSRAEEDLRTTLAVEDGLTVPVHIDRERFSDDSDATWRSLAGTGSGA